MNENKVQGILDTTIDKMRSMAGADTIIGDAITAVEGITLIPVSKVTYGFASGGSDFATQNSTPLFGGGGGGGMTVTPVAFVIISNGNVRVININSSETALDKAVGMVPEIVDKIKEMVTAEKETKE